MCISLYLTVFICVFIYIYLYLHSDSRKVQELVLMVRSLFCCVCGKPTFHAPFIDNTALYCRFCSQKMCVWHLWDASPQKFGNDIENVQPMIETSTHREWICYGCKHPKYKDFYRKVMCIILIYIYTYLKYRQIQLHDVYFTGKISCCNK